MRIRFNPKELINDLIAEGHTQASAIFLAQEECKRRHKKKGIDFIKDRNDNLIERSQLIPKIFT